MLLSQLFESDLDEAFGPLRGMFSHDDGDDDAMRNRIRDVMEPPRASPHSSISSSKIKVSDEPTDPALQNLLRIARRAEDLRDFIDMANSMEVFNTDPVEMHDRYRAEIKRLTSLWNQWQSQGLLPRDSNPHHRIAN